MTEYLAEVHKMEKFFDGFEVWFVHIWIIVLLII
jgi:hypothetical protein